MEMDLNSALNAVQQVVNHYRAFKTIQEVLQAAVLAEQRAGELAAHNRRAAEGLELLLSQKGNLEAQVNQAQAELQAAQETVKQTLSQGKDKLAAQQAAGLNRLQELQTQISGLEEELQAGREKIRQKLEEFRVEADREEARLAAAREALTALKDTL